MKKYKISEYEDNLFIHTNYKFKNGYGAKVIKDKVRQELKYNAIYEVFVFKYKNNSQEIITDTSVNNLEEFDKMLTLPEVYRILKKIRKLTKNNRR